jgi:hypothetical protein
VKKLYLYLFVLFLAAQLRSRDLVDEIVAQVNRITICRSDLNELQFLFGGRSRGLKECINDEISFQKAQELNCIPSPEDTEKRFVAFRNGHGFGYKSVEDFEVYLRKMGISSKKALAQIRRSSAISMIENILMPKNALVTKQDVKDFCLKNPKEKESAYLISFATVDKSFLLDDGTISNKAVLHWSEFDGLINRSDLAKSMLFIVDMKVGEISKPVIKEGTVFVYRLEQKIEKRLLSVDERYAEVEALILEKKKAEKFEIIKKQQEHEACVVVLTP